MYGYKSQQLYTIRKSGCQIDDHVLEVLAEVLVEVLAEDETGIGLGMHFACPMQHSLET